MKTGITSVLLLGAVTALPLKRSEISFLKSKTDDAVVFQLGNITYLANTKYPKATISLTGDRNFHAFSGGRTSFPITVVSSNTSSITQQSLSATIGSYASDDVWTPDFLESVYISSTVASPGMGSAALTYLASLNVTETFLDSALAGGRMPAATICNSLNSSVVPPGPYLAVLSDASLSLAPVYRLYEDTYRDFLFGTYESGDGSGNFTSADLALPNFGYPLIPVPSRLYYWNDPRPFAGFRVAIKDLFDIKGLVTSGGSQAWAYISSPANATAPSIQRILDLGGTFVGKYKLAQFASGANPWEWQDEHYPFNPRGDGWLTCSASSSGGGCSIAAYDWLDYAIGSDTGSSMRRPAAVSGTYGNRPSQGMITLDGVIPLGGATDTAGVFSRDPYKWAYFAKQWYTPSLHQSSNVTGLAALSVPDNDGFPKTILFPTDYLPLNNSAAEPILDALIANMSSLFGMTVKRFNFTATVQAAVNPAVNNIVALNNGPLGIINSYTQWEVIGKPLVTTWARLFDGRFPPIDSARRAGWRAYNETRNSFTAYNNALEQKNAAVEWYETYVQYSTADSCSESVMLYDIGTGGLPSYREQNLNNNPNASFLAITPKGAAVTGASICPLYGCADYTIPIGQVPYYSQVTYHTEMVPVTINMVVKRGCDFVLFNMIERLADAGVLKAVKTGTTAF
ncbi:hypothetical protein BAUCODRAFT_74794 [Baudoinia panamericana UAMH 10762]|uniref:Uncharacterized protein n=1 Tax=Baudoinia panamericana (strain UAMH 10762) TaxID=717646 RepID=M2MRD5_BAUPA|nr:uncharacterized protein BAUCODRAFT_74794 [Baudoinia panamericana UAMH 10762]EMC94003.1 hypothetical protein BAUCODRAFT_74794 [Baudoinia panamericana UAMH 10762]